MPVEHAQREAPLVVARDPGAAEAQVVLLGVLAQEAHAPLEVGSLEPARRLAALRASAVARRCLAGGRSRPTPARSVPLGRARHLHERVVVDRAGRRDHDVCGRVARRRGRRAAARASTARDHLGAADHRAPERVRAEDRLAEHVEDAVLGVVFVHRDLLEHDLALGLELAEARAPDHVAHHVEGALEVAVEHARVQRGASLSVPALSSAPIASKIWSISSEP